MNVVKRNFPIILSVILALIASLLIYSVIKAQSPTVPVVVANQSLRVGVELIPEYLTVKHYPAIAVPKTSFRSIEQVVGKTISVGPIIEGTIVRAENLSEQGSLMATLKAFAPEGWTAVELPAGGGVGMKGVKRGEVIDIYSEVPFENGTIVDKVCEQAIVLSIPDEVNKQYIVAVPDDYAPAVASLIVRGTPMTITLPSKVVE